MPVSRFQQATFASGEFDPLLAAREDVSFYYSSAKLIDNAVPLPQGGAKRREGFRATVPQRGKLTAINMSGYTFGAPNGGTAADVISDDAASTLLTTTGISTTAVYVIATIDAGAAQRVSLCDVIANLSGGTIATATLALQSSDDDVTYTTRATLTIGTSALARRFAAKPDTDLGTHRYWRIIIDNAAGADFGTDVVEIYGVASWTEAGYSQANAVPGLVRARHITTSITDEFFAILTDRNVDILDAGGTWQAAVAIPHNDAQVGEVKTSQNRDTLVIYQKDRPPHIVQRLNETDDEWRSGAFAFNSVAMFPFEDATTGGQNEIQEINFQSMAGGSRLVIEFNGDISEEIVWSGSPATNVTNLKAAIEGLDSFSSVTVTNAGSTYKIEWTGANANTFFAQIIVDILTGSGIADVSRLQFGKPPQDELWSETRGYPRCGTFYQGRHWMGGFRARSDVVVASRAGDFTDFKEDADPVATSPLVLEPNTNEQVTVENIYPGRNLQIFTSSAEIYVPDEPITPTNVALKISTRRGCSNKVQPVDVQGGTLYVDRNGTNIREYIFLDAEQSYTAEPVSTLGGHLVQQPTDIALRRSVDTDEPTILYVVNVGRGRGFEQTPAASVTIDRAQQVTAFARITSAGGVAQTVAATQNGEVCMVWNRQLAGNQWHWIEVLDEDQMGDHSEEIANPDLETFTATADQTVFSYTFTSPANESDLGVFRRADAADKWVRVNPTDYTLDSGAKTVTLDVGVIEGTLIAVAARATSLTTTLGELDGVESYVHADGRPVGPHTPSAGVVEIGGDEGFFFHARIGLRMVPRVILQAFKGQGGQSPTMKRQRIFRVLMNVERTLNIAVGIEGGTPRAVALTNYDAVQYDQDIEDILFTGLRRVSGIGSWQLEPRVEITQTEPGPFLLRSVSYDIRF